MDYEAFIHLEYFNNNITRSGTGEPPIKLCRAYSKVVGRVVKYETGANVGGGIPK
jgi:hypothetical protein